MTQGQPNYLPSHGARPIVGLTAQMEADLAMLKGWADLCLERAEAGRDRDERHADYGWQALRRAIAVRIGALSLRIGERRGEEALLRDIHDYEEAKLAAEPPEDAL